MSISAKALCFISCHADPAEHFATFAEKLHEASYEVKIFASGAAIKKFQDRKIDVITFSTENPELEHLEIICTCCSVVITDVGHPLDSEILSTLKEKAPHILRIAYYDNTEPYVPGGYSEIAAKTMRAADRVLFANASLEKKSVFQSPTQEILIQEKFGIGYYPVEYAQKIVSLREKEHLDRKNKILDQLSSFNCDLEIFVYFGGNNEIYFKQALPAFLKYIASGIRYDSFSNLVILFQQHPGAKNSNEDLKQIQSWTGKYAKNRASPNIVISSMSTEDALIVADRVLYSQTSMAPLFALTGIPAIQVGHECFKDLLTESEICSFADNYFDFRKAIENNHQRSKQAIREIAIENLGCKEDWFESLKKAISKER